MLFNFFKAAFRILIKQRGYALLNLLGLTTGLVAFVFIYLYIQNEVSYDRSWKDYQDIYRVTSEISTGGKPEKLSLTPFLLGAKLKRNFPEIKQETRLFFTDPSDKNAVSAVQYQGNFYDIPNLTIGDANVFKIFNYKFLEGNPDSCLEKPSSMVISEKIKQKIFGNADAIGKKVKTSVREYTITGVFTNKGKPSHLDFDAVISVTSFDKSEQIQLNKNWFWVNSYTYLKLSDTTNLKSLTLRANYLIDTAQEHYIKSEDIKIPGKSTIAFQPIRQVHFTTDLLYDYDSNIKPSYLYILGIVAFFILLTASINYVNFATAQSIKKARQIGIRKVLGADRKQLLRQYISESLILTFVSFLIALSIVEIIMPVFNALVGKHIVLIKSLASGYGIVFGLSLLLIIFILAVLSGSFPAFVLYILKPVDVLRGNTILWGRKRRNQPHTAASLRKSLVVFQYFAGIGVLIFTWVMAAQIHFVENRGLGFDKNNLIVVNSPRDTSFTRKAPFFVKDLEKDSSIILASTAANIPGYLTGKLVMNLATDTTKQETQIMSSFFVGNNYFKVFKFKLLKGRNFNLADGDDTTANVILNESAVKFLHLRKPIGHPISTLFARKGKIIGVVKDFNYSALYQPVEPLAFLLRPKYASFVVFRYRPGMEAQALSQLKKVWNKYNKNYTLYYTYLGKKLDSLYQKDQKMFYLFIYFSIFVIFISSLGLYGLSSFLIEQRSREISIRKVLGGSRRQILLLLSKEYLVLVLLAGALASPLIYFLTKHWLKSFAYHIPLSIFYFILSILIVCLISFLTVLIQSFNILRKSPSEYLKYE